MVISTAVLETPSKKRSVNAYAAEGCYPSILAGLTKQMGGHNSNVKCQETCRNKGNILAVTTGDQCLCRNVYPGGKKVADN